MRKLNRKNRWRVSINKHVDFRDFAAPQIDSGDA